MNFEWALFEILLASALRMVVKRNIILCGDLKTRFAIPAIRRKDAEIDIW